MKGHSLIFRK